MTEAIKKNYKLSILSSALLIGFIFFSTLFILSWVLKTQSFHASTIRSLSWQVYLSKQTVDLAKSYTLGSFGEDKASSKEKILKNIEVNLNMLNKADEGYQQRWTKNKNLFGNSENFTQQGQLIRTEIKESEKAFKEVKASIKAKDEQVNQKLISLIKSLEQFNKTALENIELHYERTESLYTKAMILITVLGFVFLLTLTLCWILLLKPLQKRMISEHENSLDEVKLFSNERDLAWGKLSAVYEFLRTISYEARIPLNGIMGMAGLLLDTPLEPRQKEYVTSINYSAEGVQTILNDIIDLAKLENDELIVENAPIDFRELLEDVVESLSLKAEDKGVEIVLDYNLNLLSGIIGDARKIRQIITNLINILVDLSNDGIVLIEVGLMETDFYGYKGRLHIEFSSRSSSLALIPTLREIEASGVSLTYKATKQMAEFLNGSVYTNRKDEQYCIVLESLFNLNNSLEDEREKITDEITNKKVLLIDDLNSSREILSRNLDSLKTRNLSFASLSEAFKKLNNHNEISSYDFIILNIRNFEAADAAVWKEIFQRAKDKKTVFIIIEPRNKSYQKYIKPDQKDIRYLSRPVKSSDLKFALSKQKTKPNKQNKEEITNFHNIKAMVVEDNIVNQKVAVYMLQKMGCKVEALNNGIQLLEKFSDPTFECDIIFMDCQMPGMDGFEASSKLRELNNSNKDIPIVALSANVMNSDRDKCFEAGMNHFIPKPLKFEDLKEALSIFIKPPIESGQSLIEKSIEPEKPLHIESESKDALVFDNNLVERINQLGNEELLKEVYNDFVVNTDSGLRSIKESIANGDVKALKKLAHYIKGCSKELGATQLSQICKQLEDIQEEGFEKEAVILTAQIDDELVKVKGFLEERIAKL
ncbi:MAG: response regulator [Candidatus Caenarcaniphilales bacterium]|nr:response regulator [Candidatus Caenarcaniphilales bacterium]